MTDPVKPRTPLWFSAAQFLVFLAMAVAFHEVRVAWGWWAAVATALAFWIALLGMQALRKRRYA